MTIVTSTYRYKPPLRKRKPVAIEGPVIVTSVDPKKMRRPATRRQATPQPAIDDGKPAANVPAPATLLPRRAAIVTVRDRKTREQQQMASAIVTARKPAKAIPDGWLPDTPEEHKRRGDAADALFQEMKRKIASALHSAPPKKKP